MPSALTAAGLDYGLLVGLATGVLAFLPFVGWALGFVAAVGVCDRAVLAECVPILLVVGVYLGEQALDADSSAPITSARRSGCHPVWLIFSLFVFSYLFGFVGALVAVPLVLQSQC